MAIRTKGKQYWRAGESGANILLKKPGRDHPAKNHHSGKEKAWVQRFSGLGFRYSECM